MQCRSCGSTENLYQFKDKTRTATRCRKCNTESCRKYRQKKTGAHKKAVDKYNMQNPIRRRAWSRARVLVSMPCVVCGEIKTDKHHPNPDEPLAVMYLCRAHHKRQHIIERKNNIVRDKITL